jgi:hypothetical protein
MTRHALSWPLAVVLSGSWTLQDACPDIPNAGTKTAAIYMEKWNRTCQVANGGFVKAATMYRVHIDATVTGGCTVMVQECSGLPPVCNCVPGGSYLRNLGTTWFYDPVSWTTPFGSIVAAQNVQDIDSRVPTGTTSTGVSWSTNVQGLHTIESVTGWNATPCMLGPTTFGTDDPFEVKVLACQPNWLSEHVPATTVRLYIPPGLWDTLVGPSDNLAASQAVGDWNDVLGGTGVTIQITDQPCGTGGDCINMSTVSPTVLGNGCADFTAGQAVSGVISAASSMRLGDTYVANATQARLRRTIAHELAHALGMHHNSCNLASSLMSAPTVCPYGCQFTSVYQACTQDTGMVTTPTPTDFFPVQPTYGIGDKTLCGF